MRIFSFKNFPFFIHEKKNSNLFLRQFVTLWFNEMLICWNLLIYFFNGVPLLHFFVWNLPSDRLQRACLLACLPNNFSFADGQSKVLSCCYSNTCRAFLKPRCRSLGGTRPSPSRPNSPLVVNAQDRMFWEFVGVALVAVFGRALSEIGTAGKVGTLWRLLGWDPAAHPPGGPLPWLCVYGMPVGRFSQQLSPESRPRSKSVATACGKKRKTPNWAATVRETSPEIWSTWFGKY